MNYIFDACALLAFLNDEEGADVVEDLLVKSATEDVDILMSIVNLFEVYYGELRDKGKEIADIVLDMVEHYSIRIVDTISHNIFLEAARLKSAYKCSLADAIGIATAVEISGQFVTSDHHEPHGLPTRTEKEISPLLLCSLLSALENHQFSCYICCHYDDTTND